MKNMVTAMNSGASSGSGSSSGHQSLFSPGRIDDLRSLEVQLLAEQKRRCEVEAELTACRKQYLGVLGANKGRGSVKPLIEKVRRAGGIKENSGGSGGARLNMSSSAYKKSLLRQRAWNEVYLEWLRKCPGVVLDAGNGGRKVTRPDQLTMKQARALTAQQRLILAEWSVLLQSEDLEIAKRGLLEEREKIREHANRIRSQLEEEELKQQHLRRQRLPDSDVVEQEVFEKEPVQVQVRGYAAQERIWQRPTPQQRMQDDEEILAAARARAAIAGRERLSPAQASSSH